MTEHSVQVRSFLFYFTTGTLNLIYFECEEVFFVRICRVFNRQFSRTNVVTIFLVCNLRPVFEKVKFDVRRSLKPFKDLNGRFDPSLTALTKSSSMVGVFYAF